MTHSGVWEGIVVTIMKGKSPTGKGNAKQVVRVDRPIGPIRPRRPAPTPVVAGHKDGAAVAPEDVAAEIANSAPQPADQRLNVRFTPEGYAQVQEMARLADKSVSETVRDALGLLGWLDERMREGSQLIIKQKDGQMFVVAKPKTLR